MVNLRKFEEKSLLSKKLKYEIDRQQNPEKYETNWKSLALKCTTVAVLIPSVCLGGNYLFDSYKSGELPSFVYRTGYEIEQTFDNVKEGLGKIVDDIISKANK